MDPSPERLFVIIKKGPESPFQRIYGSFLRIEIISKNVASISKDVLDLGEKILEQNYINQCSKDPEISKKYKIILKDYLLWFLDPGNHELKAWCPREAFAKIEAKYSQVLRTNNYRTIVLPVHEVNY